MKSYKDLFLTESNAKEHLEAVSSDKEMYYATLMLLMESDISLTEGVKANILAAIMANARYRNNYNREFLQYLFSQYMFGVREIRDTIWLMRNGKLPPKRLPRQSKMDYKRQIERLSKKKGKSLVGKLNRNKRDILKEILYNMSPDELERAYSDVEVWREVFKFLHTSPQNFTLDWFQEAIYGAKEVPADSHIGIVRSLNHENALEYLDQYKIPVKEYRKRMTITPEIFINLAKKADLKSLFRQRKMLIAELKNGTGDLTSQFDEILSRRLQNYKGILYLNYGEFIQFIEDYSLPDDLREALASQLQRNISRFPIPLSGRIRIICDNSPSMDKAVVLAFHLLLLLSMQYHVKESKEPEMMLVNKLPYTKSEIEDHYHVDLPPSNVMEAVEITKQVNCEGMTNLASSLQDVLIEESSKFDSLIFITDECENQLLDGQGLRYSYSQVPTVEDHMKDGSFAWALEKYSKEIHQRVLQTVIINIPSAGSGSYCKFNRETNTIEPYFGVTEALRNKGIPIQTYVVDSINRIEYFLAVLNADTPLFQRDVLKTRDLLREQSITEVSKKIRLAKKKLSLSRVLVLTEGKCQCGGLFSLEQINAFRTGETIQCEYCDNTFSPTYF